MSLICIIHPSITTFLSALRLVVIEGHFTPKKISYTASKNPFVLKKNPAEIRINPFVLKKSRTHFQLSETPLGSYTVHFGTFHLQVKVDELEQLKEL